MRKRLVIVLLAVLAGGAASLWYLRSGLRPVPAEYPIATAHVGDVAGVRKLFIERAQGSQLADLVDLEGFGTFHPIRGLKDAITAFGQPDNERFAENRTTLEYWRGQHGRIEVREELLVDGAAYSLRLFPVNVDFVDGFARAVARLVVDHLDLTADESLVVIHSPSRQLEMLVTLRGQRIDEIGWPAGSR